MVNKTLTNLAVTAAGLASIMGCDDNSNKTGENVPVTYDYVARIREGTVSEESLALVAQDFDEDGHVDLICASRSKVTNDTRLHYLKGDGKGNFKLVSYEVSK